MDIPWKSRRLGGLPSMTRIMLLVLLQLREARDAGFPAVPVDQVDPRTLRALERRDWIFQAVRDDVEPRYSLTKRGLRAIDVYTRPKQHTWDGTCPDCGKPRRKSPTGFLYAYCTDCNRRHGRRQYRMKGNQLDPDGLCATCKTRRRHIYPSGKVIPYCLECRTAMRKDERQRKHQRLLQRIDQGEFIPCIRCKVNPRYYNKKVVYDYCHACYRQQQNDYTRRQKGKVKV